MSIMLSKNFSEEEMSCRCCGQLPANGISPVLLEGLEQLRERIGKPIYISCAYRCPKHNAEVGGVPDSQHVDGTAAFHPHGAYQQHLRNRHAPDHPHANQRQCAVPASLRLPEGRDARG